MYISSINNVIYISWFGSIFNYAYALPLQMLRNIIGKVYSNDSNTSKYIVHEGSFYSLYTI